MRNFILISTILITGWVQAQTAAMQALVDDLNEKTGVVLEAWIEDAPVSMGRAGTLYAGRIAWVEANNNIVSQKGHEVIVKVVIDENQQITSETAYWVNTLPEPLKPVAADAFILGRTAAAANNPKRPFTAAEVESFANTQWRATAGNTAALAIKDFKVENFDSNTVRISGLFHDVATNTRQRHAFFVTLVDPNAAATGANVKFERIVEQ